MKAKRLSLISAACIAALCSTSFAYTVSGTVSDSDGKALKDVDVSLLKEGKTAKTDNKGKFTIHEDEKDTSDAIHPAFKNAVGYVNINNGILSYSQSSTQPVQVKIFNSLGNQVFKKSLQGSGTYDLSKGIKAQGTYFAQVSVGSAKQNFKFTTDGSFSSTFGAQSSGALLKEAAKDEAIRFIAEGFDTLTIPLGTLDTTLDVKLKKTEPTYKFGYALKNSPTPSKGCGTNSTLKAVQKVENGQKFQIKVGSDTRVILYNLDGHVINAGEHNLLIGVSPEAYITAVRLTDSEADYLEVAIRDQVTSIQELTDDALNKATIYDLSGRRITSLKSAPSGVYVIKRGNKQYKIKK